MRDGELPDQAIFVYRGHTDRLSFVPIMAGMTDRFPEMEAAQYIFGFLVASDAFESWIIGRSDSTKAIRTATAL